MGHKAKRLCGRPGCRGVVDGQRCSVCGDAGAGDRRREYDGRRGSARARGYTRQWDTARLAFLRAHPLCAECARHGRVTAATVVDHVVPHEGDDRLFWAEENWEALCRACHEVKHGRKQRHC